MNGELVLEEDDAPYYCCYEFDYEDHTLWMAVAMECYDDDAVRNMAGLLLEDAVELTEEKPARPPWGEEGKKYICRYYRRPKGD